MKITAIVLAAGAGTRMGGPKALLEWDGRTLLEHAARTLARPGVAQVVAVVGADSVRVLACAEAASIAAIENPHHEDGMLSSVLCGLDHADAAGADAILIQPVDHPLVAVETVDRVIAALESGARIAVPSFENRRGHPAGFARDAWPSLRTASPARGARGALEDHPDWIVHVAGDRGCRAGINTPDDYEKLRR
jgi:CTP:molybdopterin cytidylyltransferase MocA